MEPKLAFAYNHVALRCRPRRCTPGALSHVGSYAQPGILIYRALDAVDPLWIVEHVSWAHHGVMVADQGSWGDAAQWYPDVVALGAVHDAWQAEFGRHGSLLQAQPRVSRNPRTATIENGEQNAYLILSPWEREFILGLGTGRMVMLSGHAPDLAVAADAAHAWLSGARPPAIADTWPFFGSVALAIARERGDHREASWLNLYENCRVERVATRLQPFVVLAFHEPRLRQLMPYTSHWTLRFSASSNWPYTGSYPAVTPTKTPGRYVVTNTDGRTHDETDAASAFLLVLNDLPKTVYLSEGGCTGK